NGTVDNLLIDQLELSTLNNTAIQVKGNIKKIREPQLMYADVQLLNLQTGKRDIEHILNPDSLPKTIEIPADIHVKGRFKGYTQNFDGEAAFVTSIGNAAATIRMNPGNGNKEQAYDAHINIEHFDLGRLLKDTAMLGQLTVKTDIKGQGLTDSTIHAQLKTVVE